MKQATLTPSGPAFRYRIKVGFTAHQAEPSLHKPSSERIWHAMSDMTPVDIVIGVDAEFYAQAAAVIQSIIDNSNPSRRYRVWILTEEMSDRDSRYFSRFSHLGNFEITTVRVRIDFPAKSPLYPPASFLRLMISKALPHLSKIVYLDSDVYVCRDIGELFDIDTGDAIVGAVQDFNLVKYYNSDSPLPAKIEGFEGGIKKYIDEYVGLKQQFGEYYFNSGVVVVNLALWRQFKIEEKVLEITENRKHGFVWADQDIINRSVAGRVMYLDPKWNVLVSYVGETRDAGLAIAEAGILHYAGPKPWKDIHTVNPKPFMEAAIKSPFGAALIAESVLESLNSKPMRLAIQKIEQELERFKSENIELVKKLSEAKTEILRLHEAKNELRNELKIEITRAKSENEKHFFLHPISAIRSVILNMIGR